MCISGGVHGAVLRPLTLSKAAVYNGSFATYKTFHSGTFNAGVSNDEEG